MKTLLSSAVVAVFAVSGASAQTPCASGTTLARVRCLDAEAASRQATDAALARDNDALERSMRDADEAIRVRLDGQAAKIDDLLARVSALEAGAPPTPEPDPGVPTPPPAPGPAGGPLAQLGLYWWRYWSYEEPFIDLTRRDQARWSAVLHGGARMPFEDLWAGGHIDKTTLYPKSFPPNTWYVMGGRSRHGASVLPAAYAGTYVIAWEGDADIEFAARTCPDASAVNCQRRVSANRVEATFDAASTDIGDWRIMRIGPGGVRNIKVFRKQHEGLLQSGKILNPVFRDYARRYRVLRFMDPQEASQGRPFRAGDFARMDQATWAPDWKPDYEKAPDAPKYPPFEALFRVAMETDTAAWVHVAGLPGAPATFNALIEPADSGLWKDACQTHLAAILASPDWAAYMDGIVQGLQASGYPAARLLYLEPWNEVWNWGGPWARMTHCARGVWEARSGPPDQMAYRWGYGFLAGKVQREFDAALARAGRPQQWRLVIAGQNVQPVTTTAALEGLRAYWRSAGLSDAETRQRLAYVGVSVSSYYDGSLSRTGGFLTAASDAEHLTALKAAIANGTASRLRREWLTGPPKSTWGPNIAAMVANRAAHRRVAESYGAFFLGDYEGESHEVLPGYLKADPVVARWNEDFITGPDGEAVTRAWAQALLADDPDAIVSNYMGAHPRSPGTDPWYDGYYSESNGRTRGLETILRHRDD